MSTVLRYTGTFVNTETTRPDNTNIQQTCLLNIYDTEWPVVQAPITIAAIFHETPHKIRVAATTWFYVGQVFTVAGVSTNVGPFTVNNIETVGADIDVFVNEVTAGFFETAATFTDTAVMQPEPAPATLEMTDEPVKISVIDNDEDKFTPVRSKQLQANVYTNDLVSISEFAEGGDQRWKVEYYVNSILKFVGFLSISDLQQEFMPDPNVLTLTATDGLGFLSDIPLVDFDGLNPENENPIMDYIAWALRKTGLQLNIVVCMNIRERFATPLVSDDSGDGHFFKWISIDAKTFEQNIGESEDCRTVLEKILGELCTLYQDNGTWFIKRTDEFEFGHPDYLFTFDYQGTFLSKSEETFEKSIGVDLTLAWMNDDALVLLERAYRRLLHTYNYNVPKEIPCNVDYQRGDESFDADVQRPGYVAYNLDCWTKQRLWGADATTVSWKAAILRKFNEFDDETERFIMLTKPASETGSFEFIKSSRIPLGFMDRFTFTFEASALQDTSGDGSILVCIILLYGADGTVYILRSADIGTNWDNTLGEIDTQWRVTDEEVSLFRDGLQWGIFDDADHPQKTEWAQFTMNAAPLPQDGDVVIHLFSANQFSGSFDDFDIRYQNLQFEYRHYIGGSYRRYTGHEHRVRQGVNTVAAREEEIFLDTSPKKLFKGALLKADDTRFVLAKLFYNAALDPNGNFADDNLIMSFGKLRAYDVWNQINRLFSIADGTVDGLESSTTIPDLKHRYTLTDVHRMTTNKMFMLLHFEQDHHLCEWDGFLMEVADSTIPKLLTGHELKLITKDG